MFQKLTSIIYARLFLHKWDTVKRPNIEKEYM